MSKLIINTGTSPNSKNGDSIRDAFTKVNSNFDELYSAMGADVQIPAQAGYGGYYLTTNGSTLSWTVPVTFPYQTGNAGKVLTTDGTGVFWGAAGSGGGASLSAFSVTTNSANGSGSLAYNNITGVFTFTPPVVPTVPTYTVATGSASGGGSLTLSGSTFTFVPASVPTVPTYTITTNTANGNGSLTLSGSTFTFVPANIPTYSVSTTTASGGGTLSISGSTFTFAPAVQYSLPTATTSVLGGVKIDNNSIVINNGVISVGGALTSATIFKGAWDASANTPTLSNSLPAGVASGWQYIVSVQGTRDIGSGSTAYTVGDLVIYNGTSWSRIPGGNNVTAFNTRQGSITLTSSDVTTALGFTPYNSTNPSNHIALTGLSITTNAASGSGSLSYNNTSGVFTFTPPNLSNYLTSITSSNVITALGFTPYNSTNPSNYITLSGLSVTTNAGNSTSSLSYSSLTGAFTFTPYALPTAVAGTSITGTKGGVIPDGTSIVINNGVISSVSSAPNLTINTAAASGSGGLTYAVSTGTFTYTPPLGSYLLGGVSIASSNGFAGTNASGTITLSTSINGVLKGNGTSILAASAGTDYQAPIGTISGIVKGNGANALTAAISGTDYVPGTSALATGILKNTTTTGALSIASSLDINSTFGSQTANYIYSAPNGFAGTPSFRAVVLADISNLGTGVATFLATPTSANLVSAVTDETGTGTLVFSTSPAISTSITTASTSFDLINTTATTVNFAKAATTLSIGGSTGTTTVNNNFVITGNLTVNGTTETINATTITVDDINIELGSVATPTDVTAAGGGITLKGASDKTISWGATNGWTSSEDINVASGKIYRINGTSVLSSSTLGSGVTGSSLTSVGTIGTGVWQGTIVGATYGGTGVNNGANTLTLAGNVSHAGAFTQTFTAVGNTSLTLPTSGTVTALGNTTTGSGNIVLATSPTLSTPTIGVATATSINKMAITAPATGSTLAVADGKTFTVNNTITLAGTDSTTITLPATTGTVALNNQTFFIGSTSIAINRATASQSLTGITSIDGYAAGLAGGNTTTLLGALPYQSAANTTTLLSPNTTATKNFLVQTGTGTNGAAPAWGTLATGDIPAHFIGTTSITFNRASASQSLTGVNIDGSAGSASKATNLVGGNSTTLLGSIGYQSGTDTTTLLGPNTTATKKFLRQTGDGTNGAAPAWDTLVAGDIPSLTSAQLATILSDETGTGVAVFGTSPAITTSITTASTSFDLVNTTATTVNFAGAGTTLSIGNTATAAQTVNMFTASTGASTYNFATGATASATTKAINIGTAGVSGSTTNISLGSSVSGALGTITHYGNTTLSSGSLTFSGNISAAAWTTSGIRHVSSPATLTDTTSTGTVANAYTNNFGGNTIAASNATTYTNYATVFVNDPTAGTNVTFTNAYSLITAGNVKLGSTGTGTITAVAATATTASTAASVGYIGTPINTQASTYTLVIGDAGKTIYAGGNLTIPANASVAFPIGTTINVIASAGITIAITSDTLQWGGQATSTTGTRTVATYGMATLVKVTNTIWYISGVGVT